MGKRLCRHWVTGTPCQVCNPDRGTMADQVAAAQSATYVCEHCGRRRPEKGEYRSAGYGLVIEWPERTALFTYDDPRHVGETLRDFGLARTTGSGSWCDGTVHAWQADSIEGK